MKTTEEKKIIDIRDASTWVEGLELKRWKSHEWCIAQVRGATLDLLMAALAPSAFFVHFRDGTRWGGVRGAEETYLYIFDIVTLSYNVQVKSYELVQHETSIPLFFCTNDTTKGWILRVHDMGALS